MLPPVFRFTLSIYNTWVLWSILSQKSLTCVYSARTETITKVTTKNCPVHIKMAQGRFYFFKSTTAPQKTQPFPLKERNFSTLARAERASIGEWESSSTFPLGAARWKEDARRQRAHTTHTQRQVYNKYNFFAVRLFFSSRQSRPGMDIYLWVEQGMAPAQC